MKTHRNLVLLASLVLTCLALPAGAADRMRAGQWTGTTIIGSKTFPTSSCVSQSEADAMNGDAKAVQAYLQKIIPPEICKITDVKVDRGQVIYTAACVAGAPKVVTTTYHGDSAEGTDSTGSKTSAKLVGACK